MSSPDDEPEELLAGDGVTRVVRIGQTVHRPTRPFTATIQAFLAHLHAHGFGDAPEPLGYDPQGREVLSYIPGAVPVEPLPTWATTLDVLADLARVIRRLPDGCGPARTGLHGRHVTDHSLASCNRRARPSVLLMDGRGDD